MKFFNKSRSSDEIDDLDYLHSALNHETRRLIVKNLGEKGILSFTIGLPFFILGVVYLTIGLDNRGKWK